MRLFLAGALAMAFAGTAQAQERRVVWAVGDGGDGTAEAQQVSALIQADAPDALLYLGDVYPDGTAADFSERYDPVFGALKSITWPTPGNHDWGNSAAGYFPYWGRRIKPWYRLNLAGWEIISLNSETRHDRRSAQVRWLKRVLALKAGTCRLAFWHRPLRSPGLVHGGTANVAPLWNALRGHARLVVNAHDHLMARFQRIDELTEYVSGAGGYTLYETRPDHRVDFSRSGVRGALRIALSRGRATLEFRSVTGAVLDRSGARCRPLRGSAAGARSRPGPRGTTWASRSR
ncbi:MAG: hypothetical protein QOE60_2419 [Thermoleophilaceae bacterium]|nr:hypothetical protein [Thermoleophilaceae bacterium]